MYNPHFFSWMGVINAAAYWKSTGGNMSVLFGQKVARGTMVSKLSNLISRKEVERRMITTMKKQLFVEGAWDNTQSKETIRFQREGTSALMKIYTSIVFTKPTVPDDIDDWEFGEDKALITYVDQRIKRVVYWSFAMVVVVMVVSLVVIYALCEIVKICPHRVTENCVYHFRGLLRNIPNPCSGGRSL